MLSTGYVGAPRGMPHCDDVGHLIVTWVVDHDSSDDMNGEHCVRTLHAEQNVICEAAKLGIALRGSTFYTTMVPCYSCAMLMTAVGVLRVVSLHPYQSGSAAEKLFRQVGISLVVKENRELY